MIEWVPSFNGISKMSKDGAFYDYGIDTTISCSSVTDIICSNHARYYIYSYRKTELRLEGKYFCSSCFELAILLIDSVVLDLIL